MVSLDRVSLDAARARLGRMTERILLRLADRAGFPLNAPVYEPGGIALVRRQGISFLEFAIEGLEAYHASLGRYEYPDQYALSRGALPRSGARREVGVPALPRIEIDLRDRLLRFYRDEVLPPLCIPDPAVDANTYGETAYIDADVLELIHERINIGRYVARAKLDTTPDLLAGASAAELTARLRDVEQEDRVLSVVRASATRYGIAPAVAELVFRWVIEQTIEVEVAYLRALPPAP
jgi:chorismate mutase